MDRTSTTVPAEQCVAPSAHIDAWHVAGGQVVCSVCRPRPQEGSAGWHSVASVLKGMPIYHEMLRRAIERGD